MYGARVYIAGPFFNEQQIRRIGLIEALLDGRKIDYFSPRQTDASKEIAANGFTSELAKVAFDIDVMEIGECSVLLAVLDWLNPKGQEVRAISTISPKTKPKGGRFSVVAYGPPLNVPDSDTVWEMGCAGALGKPVVGFRTCPSATNLMLAAGCLLWCDGWEALGHFFDSLAPTTPSCHKDLV